MAKEIVKAQLLPTTFATLPADPVELSKRIGKLTMKKIEDDRLARIEIENQLKQLSNRTWYVAIHEVDKSLREEYRMAINTKTEELIEKYHSIPNRITINRRFKMGDDTVKDNLLNLIAWVVEHYNTTQTLSPQQASIILGNIQANHGDLRLEDVAICFRERIGEKVFAVDPALFNKWLGEYKQKLGEYRMRIAYNQSAAQKFVR